MKESLFEISLTICEVARLDYFALDELPADDVIEFACNLIAKGKRADKKPVTNSQPDVIRKRVYADTANWY